MPQNCPSRSSRQRGHNIMTTTKAKDWKKGYQVELELPESGNVVEVRPLDAAFWFKSGRIPDFIAPIVDDIITNKSYEMPNVVKNPPEKMQEFLTWLDEIVSYAIVNPQVVSGTPTQDEQISIDDISYSDKLFIYSLFGRAASVLRRFREQQAKPVVSLDAAKSDRAAAKQVAKHNAVGQ